MISTLSSHWYLDVLPPYQLLYTREYSAPRTAVTRLHLFVFLFASAINTFLAAKQNLITSPYILITPSTSGPWLGNKLMYKSNLGSTSPILSSIETILAKYSSNVRAAYQYKVRRSVTEKG